jgi:hypothetical protein
MDDDSTAQRYVPAMASFVFDRFLRFDDLTTLLHEVAAEYAALCELSEIGRSYEGRAIWLLTITDSATGPHDAKPALWVDASIHATELSGTVAALHLVHRLLTGHDEVVERARRTRTMYVVPRVNPDGAEAALADRPRRLRSSTRPWPWNDPRPRPGLYEDDLDSDGRVLQMRVVDADGAWKRHPDEARLLVARGPADDPTDGPYYRLLSEGTIVDFDGVTIPLPGPPEGLDLNRNFPAGWKPQGEQKGSGEHPGSEPEVRALIDAVTARPNICAYVALHTYGGVLLRPSSMKPDDQLPRNDVLTFNAIGRIGADITGYPTYSTFHDFTHSPTATMTGAADDWAYEHLGLTAWTVEIWDPVKAGVGEHKHPIRWDDYHPVSDDLAMLAWADRNPGAFVDWYRFDHPQLGAVELGGWDYLHAWGNPPSALLEGEVSNVSLFLLHHALLTPELHIHSAEAVAIGDGTWRVRVVVANIGWLPTNITERATQAGVVRPLVAELLVADGVEVVSGPRRLELGQLAGRPIGGPAFAAWTSDGTPDRAKAEWVVTGSTGIAIVVEIAHQRAGRARVSLTLP